MESGTIVVASVSLRKAFDINRNPLCQVLPLLQTFTPVKLPVAWQFGAKYYLLTKDRIKFAVHRHLCDITDK